MAKITVSLAKDKFAPRTLTIIIESKEELEIWRQLGLYNNSMSRKLDELCTNNGININRNLASNMFGLLPQSWLAVDGT